MRGHRSGEVRRAARSSDHDLDPSIGEALRPVADLIGSAVGGEHTGLVFDTEPLEGLFRDGHDRRVARAAHDDRDLRAHAVISTRPSDAAMSER